MNGKFTQRRQEQLKKELEARREEETRKQRNRAVLDGLNIFPLRLVRPEAEAEVIHLWPEVKS
jgi:hypothetical protein